MDTAGRIRELVAPLVDEAGAELYDVEFTGGILRISVDRPGGADIGTIGRLTRSISDLLDERDPIAGQYTLEVSSPGLERPLRTPAHFARAVGDLVAVKTRPGIEGDRRFRGTVTGIEGTTVTIRVEGGDDERRLDVDDVERARTVFEWAAAPKPGGRSGSPSAKKKKAAKS